jgi:hypothetical protein
MADSFKQAWFRLADSVRVGHNVRYELSDIVAKYESTSAVYM